MTCLIECASAELQGLWDELHSAGAIFRLVEITLDLAHLRHKKAGDWKDHGPAASAAMSLLPEPFQELGVAYLEILNERPPTVSQATRHMVEAINERTEDIRRLRLAISVPGVQDDSGWLLHNAEDPDIAVEALRGAERAELAEVLNSSLKHKFADVRAEALRAVAGKLVAPLPTSLLEKVSDKGKSVRMALGTLLDAKIDPTHMPTLLRLARDKYSTGTHYVDNNAVLPIARSAVEAIKKYGPLAREDADELKGIAISADDPILRGQIFDLLATNGDTFGQELLFDLNEARETLGASPGSIGFVKRGRAGDCRENHTGGARVTGRFRSRDFIDHSWWRRRSRQSKSRGRAVDGQSGSARADCSSDPTRPRP